MKKNIKLFILAIGFMILFGVENVFAADNYTIRYSGCQQTSSNSYSQAVKMGETITPFRCEDSGFLGWYISVPTDSIPYLYCIDDPKGENISKNKNSCEQGRYLLKNGESFTYNNSSLSQIDFTAVFFDNADKFTVKFDPGISEGVTGTMDSIEVVIGSSTKIPTNQFKREGYEFAGWEAKINGQYMCEDGNIDDRDNCKKSHGGIKIYSDGASISQTGTPGITVAFVATWKNGSSSSSSSNNLECSEITNETDCTNKKCSWNKDYNFCSKDGLAYLSCGDAKDIPAIVPDLISKGVTMLKTVAPIVLIIMAIIQLVKAIMGSKEDEIKKAQASLVKKAIAAALVFFVITIVQFIVLKVADSNETNGTSEKTSLSSCLSCFLNGTGDSECGNIYYKDGDKVKKVSK